MRVLAATVLSTLAMRAGAEPPAPAPPVRDAGAERPAPPAGSLTVGHAVAEAVTKMLATPRFEEQVEVRDRYQEALDATLRAASLGCGATPSGPPTPNEMSRFGGREIPPTADLLAGLKWLHRKVVGKPPEPRYFLYSAHLRKAPERSVYVVHDGVLPENVRASVPDADWVLVGSYAERDAATEVLERLQRGGAASDRRAPALWAVSPCPR
jgi:hypothetical protein